MFWFGLFFHCCLCSLYLKNPLSDIVVNKATELNSLFSENVFANTDQSTIFRYMESNTYVTATLSNPVVIPGFTFLKNIQDVIIEGNYAYVSEFQHGLFQLDISDPSNIRPLKKQNNFFGIDTQTEFRTLQRVGDYIYLLHGNKGIETDEVRKLNVTKENDWEVSEVNFGSGPLSSVFMQEDVFFASRENSIIRREMSSLSLGLTIDFASTNIRHVLGFGRYVYFTHSVNLSLWYLPFSESVTWYKVVSIEHTSSTGILHSSGNLLFVSKTDAVMIYNITNITTPKLIHEWNDTDYFQQNSCTEIQTFTYSEPNLYIGMKHNCSGLSHLDGMVILNLTDLTNPKVSVDRFSIFGGIKRIRIIGEVAYLGCPERGFQILNVSSNRTSVSRISTKGSYVGSEPKAMVVYGNFLFVVAKPGLHIVDFRFSGSDILRSAGNYNDEVQEGNDIFLDGSRVFVNDISSESKGIKVFNITNFGSHNQEVPNIVFLGSFNHSCFSKVVVKILVRDNFLYAACGVFVQIYDISLIQDVSFIKSVDSESDGNDIKDMAFHININDEILLALGARQRMQRIDISNPPSSTRIMHNDVNCDVMALAVSNEYVYIACNTDGLKILKYNDNIYTSVSTLDTIKAYKVRIQGNIAYVLDDFTTGSSFSFLNIIDVSDPEYPFLDDQTILGTEQSFESLATKDNYAFVINSANGIEVYRYRNGMKNGKSFEQLCGDLEVSLIGYDCCSEIQDVVKITKYDYCNGNGKCLENYNCQCNSGFSGSTCTDFLCFDILSTSADACSGRGVCTAPATCECNYGYNGKNCENTWLFAAILAPTGTLAVGSIFFGVISISILVCILICFCFCCVLLCVSAFSFVIIMGIGLITGRLAMYLSKYRKLKDIDLLLREQEMEENTEVAHLKINKALFEVHFSDIKTISILGEGGSNSIVFKAIWKGKECAFKCFKTRNLMTTQSSFTEFEREVELLSSLSHPNIISFYGACLSPPRVGILMEFCPNGELLEFFQKFREKNMDIPYPFYQKIRLLTELSSAIEALHDKNVIHRDLKSENVLISKEESAKLMDFGLSKFVKSMDVNKTRRIGTAIYMAPEVVQGTIYTEKCDIYSLGILMYVVFVENDKPYGKEEYNVELKVAGNADFRPPLKPLKDALGEEFDWMIDLIINCWSHDYMDRYSCKRIREILEEKGGLEIEHKNTSVGGEEEEVSVVVGSVSEVFKESESDDFKNRVEELEKELLILRKENAILRKKIKE